MIIALPPKHNVADELAALCSELRQIRRGEAPDDKAPLAIALNLTETIHGNHAATYLLLPGRADSEGAVTTYRHIRSHYPGILELLCMAADRGAGEVTIEIGTLGRRDHILYSHHNLVSIMPRVLAGFRGLNPPHHGG